MQNLQSKEGNVKMLALISILSFLVEEQKRTRNICLKFNCKIEKQMHSEHEVSERATKIES